MSAVDFPVGVPQERSRGLVSPRDLVDAGFLSAAAVLGLIGFHATYGGYRFLIGGILGIVVGIAISHVVIRFDLPSAVAVGVAIVAFFALGGAVALRTGSTSGALPTPSTIRALGGASVHGWRQLLTLLPPVGDTGALLVIPYLLGMTAGVAGYLLARRSRRALLPAVAPCCVLAASILFGTPAPTSLTLQGAAFAVVILAWGSVRQSRRVVATANSGRSPWRLLLALALLGLTGAVAQVAGPHLPDVHSHQRVVLRNYVHPPFDPSAYPSPLGAFRKYVSPKSAAKRTLMVVKGLPPGARIRFATMDSYDGYAWGVTNGSSNTAGAFQRVGSRVDDTVRGQHVHLTVQLRGYSDVWLPDVGYTERVRFAGANASTLRDAYRYNLVTGTSVVLSRVHSGDEYTLDATLPAAPSAQELAGATPGSQPVAFPGQPAKVAPLAKAWAGTGSAGAFAELQTMARRLKNGAYSDGVKSKGPQSRPGHGDRRLTDFLDGAQLVGDDEQYAATFALLASALGFPTRVVIGATPEADGTVKGIDVHAWDEVDLNGAGWITISVTPPKNRHPNPNPPKVLDVNRTPTRVPPPNPSQPPSARSLADTSNSSASLGKGKHAGGGGLHLGFLIVLGKLLGAPVATVALLLGLIAGLKSSRRKRRRSRGTPAERVVAGWCELVDLAVDLGSPRPPRGTRREDARHLLPDLDQLARRADATVFGPDDPTEAVAASYWATLDETRVRLLGAATRRERLRALVSLRSFGLARRPAGLAFFDVAEVGG
jgi:Transglutaminase-like superfamily